jgi:hypothetical protein
LSSHPLGFTSAPAPLALSSSSSPSEPTPSEEEEPESDLQLIDRLLNEVVFFKLPPEFLELISVTQVVPKSKNKKKKKKVNLNLTATGSSPSTSSSKRNPFALLAIENE